MKKSNGQSVVHRSFLDRLAQLPRNGDIDSVVRNLRLVFNTKKNCGSVIPDFGLGEYERASNARDAVELLRQEMRAQIERYEPRLLEPELTLLGRHGFNMVRFELKGTVDGVRRSFEIDIDTTYRNVEVSPERAS